ncbi:hypothetical protein [Acidocella sp.]|uniref:hypothetical protein n=1 Tax=Acidocella sp. TaxID=50710 RepID=UPI0026072CC2|nr:hypothetical protein [Acidocella sp.]
MMPLLMVMTLAGCAREPGLQARMRGYVGQPEQKLVQELGVPDKQIAVNGYEYLAYVRADTQFEPDISGPIWGPYGMPMMVGPDDVVVWRCEITFAVQNAKVLGVAFKGNACR